MFMTPSAARVMNHSSMIGPKKVPTRAVPCFWNTNSTIRMTSVSGTT